MGGRLGGGGGGGRRRGNFVPYQTREELCGLPRLPLSRASDDSRSGPDKVDPPVGLGKKDLDRRPPSLRRFHPTIVGTRQVLLGHPPRGQSPVSRPYFRGEGLDDVAPVAAGA